MKAVNLFPKDANQTHNVEVKSTNTEGKKGKAGRWIPWTTLNREFGVTARTSGERSHPD